MTQKDGVTKNGPYNNLLALKQKIVEDRYDEDGCDGDVRLDY